MSGMCDLSVHSITARGVPTNRWVKSTNPPRTPSRITIKNHVSAVFMAPHQDSCQPQDVGLKCNTHHLEIFPPRTGRCATGPDEVLRARGRFGSGAMAARASPPSGRKARDAFRPKGVSVSSHLGLNSFNNRHISPTLSEFAASLIVSVDHFIEALDVGRLSLLQDGPCAVKAKRFRKAISHFASVLRQNLKRCRRPGRWTGGV
jgi:hypothetical protein